MEIDEIPQDDSKIYRGQKRVIYATRQGHYESATTSGWDTEEFATSQAVAELDELAEQALQAVKCGEKSPIFYLMYKNRFDLQSLSQATGIWQWRIRRHFRPEVFDNLSLKVLNIYMNIFQQPLNIEYSKE